MAIRIDDDLMSLEIVSASLRLPSSAAHAAADGQGAWVVSCLPARVLTRNQAITALTVAELLSTGCATTTRS
jgi:hypothetical protein